MDWKEILGDVYTDDIATKITTAIAAEYAPRGELEAAVAASAALEGQLKEANTAIDGFKDLDVEGMQKARDDWKQRFEQLQKDSADEKARLTFANVLDNAVRDVGGLSAVSIRAELGDERVAALMGSSNQAADIKQALDGLKADKAFLFKAEEAAAVPAYAAGTGSAQVTQPSGTGGLKDSVKEALFGQK